MHEESQLDEMRRALRGDFERLAERRGEQELLQVSAPVRDAGPEESEPRAAASIVARTTARALTFPSGVVRACRVDTRLVLDRFPAELSAATVVEL